MILREEDIRQKTVLSTARELMAAIRTSPKTRGRDYLEILLVDGDDLNRIADAMDAEAKQKGEARKSFARDAGNIRESQAMVLLGVDNQVLGLNCGWCGFADCAEKTKTSPAAYCAFNLIDLGIGTGSAVALAADRRVDNRVMFSAGQAGVNLKLFSPRVTAALGIPLSVSKKSPFYDRK